MAVPQINLEGLSAIGGKPKDYFLLEFFRLYEKYWDTMIANPDNDVVIDTVTGLILATCPSKQKRQELWKAYLENKKPTDGDLTASPLNASILSIGDLFDFLNTTMEFTEEAYAGT